MSDKSPRQSLSKKHGKSLKEKRAIKKAKKTDGESAPLKAFLRREPGGHHT
jgi:hypothetical protein